MVGVEYDGRVGGAGWVVKKHQKAANSARSLGYWGEVMRCTV